MGADVSKEMYASAFDSSLDAVFLTSSDGTIFAANQAACRLLGRSEEEICRIGRAGVVDPESPELPMVLAERARTGTARGRVRYQHADGSRIPVEMESREFTGADGRRWNVIMAHDLRQRVAIENELASTHLLLETIVNTTGDFIWSVDHRDFGILWFNDTLREYFAANRGIQLKAGMRPQDLFDDDDHIRFWQDLYGQALLHGTASCEYEVSAGTHVLEVSLTTMRVGDDVQGISAFGRDVTDRQASLRQLKESEARYRTIVDTIAEGIMFQAADGTILSVNPAAEVIEDRGEDDMLGKTSEDPQWGAVRADGSPFPGEEHPSMETLRTGKPLTGVVMGIMTPSGERRWISINSAPVFGDDSGRPTAVVTTFHDITRRKLAEDQLRVAATAFQESQEAMMITDADTRILQVNRSFVEMTGYGEEEILGQTPRALSSGRQGVEFYQQMWEGIRAHHRWQGEIWNRRRNGEIYPEWLSITAVTDDQERITNYVGTFMDLSEVKRAEQDIHRLSFYDALTGLPNRALLADRLGQAVLSGVGGKSHGALLILDLDDFTVLNDTRGHAAGDRLLREVGRILSQAVGVDGTVARLGSDEFAILVESLHHDPGHAAGEAERLAQRLQRALDAPFDIDEQAVQCRSSIGIAIFAGGEPAPAELLRRADAAVMQAKQAGRNSIRFYNPELQSALETRVAIESDLRLAIPAGLRLVFQPQVDDRSLVVGAEALIRWQDPRRGEVAPVDFIPLAEDNGMIIEIGAWVLETACWQLRAWEDHASTRHLELSVNVSARQFREASFVDTVVGAIASSGVDASRLTLELTESLLIEDVEVVAAKMADLRRHGVRFSLDDFGTGYSSLRILKNLPLHQLKIDQSFVQDLPGDASSSAIVRAAIALGQSLGLSVVAEGVETDEQATILRALGCTSFQGYLFGRPSSAADLEALIDAQAQGR